MVLSFAELVALAHNLDSEKKRQLLELLQKWLADERREERRKNYHEAQSNYDTQTGRRAKIDELMTDLFADDIRI